MANDVQFGKEQKMFGGSSVQDQYPTTPAFVMKGNQLLGVLYGGNPVDLLNAQDQIFARWLQKKVAIRDASGAQQAIQGAYGPDRQWLQTAAKTFQGTLAVYAEDGVTPLAAGPVNLSAGTAYQLVFSSNRQ